MWKKNLNEDHNVTKGRKGDKETLKQTKMEVFVDIQYFHMLQYNKLIEDPGLNFHFILKELQTSVTCNCFMMPIIHVLKYVSLRDVTKVQWTKYKSSVQSTTLCSETLMTNKKMESLWMQH